MRPAFIDPKSVPQLKLYNGMSVPALGLGTFGSDHYTGEQVARAVGEALKCGYRLLDCASVYGNENLIGEVLADAFATGAVKREDLFIQSKVWNDQHGKGDVLLSLAKTLKDLGIDYVDAYYVHWPFPNYHAPGCDGDSRNPDSKPFSVDEFMGVWRQMERIYDMGLAKNICMSNMTVHKLNEVLPLCRVKPSMIEMELHPSFQQKALLEYVKAHGIQPVGFCPIGSPARPERDTTPEDVADTQLPEVVEVARAHGVHPAIICLKWAAQSGVIPIPFSASRDHIMDNLLAVINDPLTDDEMALLAKADCNCRLIKGQVFLWPGATDWKELWDGEA